MNAVSSCAGHNAFEATENIVVGVAITMMAVNVPVMGRRVALGKYCSDVLFFAQLDSFRPPHLN